MMLGGKIVDLTVNDDIPLKSYDHCLPQVVCNPSQPACYLGTCGLCPRISGLKEHLNSLMDDCLTDNVIYRQWVRMCTQIQLVCSWTLVGGMGGVYSSGHLDDGCFQEPTEGFI